MGTGKSPLLLLMALLAAPLLGASGGDLAGPPAANRPNAHTQNISLGQGSAGAAAKLGGAGLSTSRNSGGLIRVPAPPPSVSPEQVVGNLRVDWARTKEGGSVIDIAVEGRVGSRVTVLVAAAEAPHVLHVAHGMISGTGSWAEYRISISLTEPVTTQLEGVELAFLSLVFE